MRRIRVAAVQAFAVAGGVVVSAAVLTLIGQSFGDVLSALVKGAFGTSFGLTQTALKAIPLALTGLAVALPLRMRLWNIGAEGQFHLGAIGATWVAMTCSSWSAEALLPAMVVGGMAGGAAWALLAALPRAIWGVNEIITTLLLNYVAIQLLAYLVTGPWRGEQSFNFPITDPLPDAARLPNLGGSLVHVGVFAPVASAALLAFALHRTAWGFQVRMTGASPEAALAAGMSIRRNVVGVMLIGGALAGVAGMIELSATFGQLQQGISPGYGYMAIVIAALASGNLLGTLVVAFLFGGFVVGGLAMQTRGVPQAFVLMLQGIILFCALAGARLAGNGLTPWRRARRIGREEAQSIP